MIKEWFSIFSLQLLYHFHPVLHGFVSLHTPELLVILVLLPLFCIDLIHIFSIIVQPCFSLRLSERLRVTNQMLRSNVWGTHSLSLLSPSSPSFISISLSPSSTIIFHHLSPLFTSACSFHHSLLLCFRVFPLYQHFGNWQSGGKWNLVRVSHCQTWTYNSNSADCLVKLNAALFHVSLKCCEEDALGKNKRWDDHNECFRTKGCAGYPEWSIPDWRWACVILGCLRCLERGK